MDDDDETFFHKTENKGILIFQWNSTSSYLSMSFSRPTLYIMSHSFCFQVQDEIFHSSSDMNLYDTGVEFPI